MNLHAKANQSRGLSLTLLSAVLFSTASYSIPFNIFPEPGLSFPKVMAEGSTVYATYVVENNSLSQRDDNYVKYLPPGVSVVGGTCMTSFNLAPSNYYGSSCTLELAIKQNVNGNDSNPHNHLFVCYPGGKTCAGTPVPLNVAELKGAGYSGLADVTNIGTDIYVGGANNMNFADMWKYSTFHWSNAYLGSDNASFVEALASANDTSVFIAGDYHSGGLLDHAFVRQYNPLTKQTVDTGFATQTQGTGLSSLVFGGNILYAGGEDVTGNHGQVWWYKNGVWTSTGISDPAITSVTALGYYAPQNIVYDAVINATPPEYAQVQALLLGTWVDTGLYNNMLPVYMVDVEALAVDASGNVYAGGYDSNFDAAVWKYDGSSWTALPTPSVGGEIYALAFNSNGTLYAGGFDGVNYNGQVWYYDGSSWISKQLQGSFEVFSIVIDPNDTLYGVGLSSFGITGGVWSLTADD